MSFNWKNRAKRMKTATALFLAAALVGGVSSGRVLQDIPEVGLGPMRPVTSSTSQGGDEPATPAEEAELIAAIEADDQVTVVSGIKFAEVLCSGLDDAEDADLLILLLLEDEVVIAEKTSSSVFDGDAFTDGIGRKAWTGVIVSPAQAEDEAVRRTLSMTWGDVCDPETFLLKVTKRNLDGTTSIAKTFPCFGSTTHTCMLEVMVEFDEADDALIPDDDTPQTISEPTSSSYTSGTESTTGSSSRRLQQVDTVIDVMVLYSVSSLTTLGGITSQQMETIILESLVGTNEALGNSEVSAYFNPVRIGPLPYEVTTSDSASTLSDLQANADVGALRDTVGADLVQMVDDFDNSCGRSFLFNSDDVYGYSVVRATCFDNFAHTHVFGQNLGCHRNREDTSFDNEYAHGWRYCDGEDPYRTVMSFSCGTPRVNYFSNPDVSFLDKPTGTLTDDNARAIGDNMVAVSNYRKPVRPPTPTPSTTLPTPATPTIAPSAPAATPAPFTSVLPTTPPTTTTAPSSSAPPTTYTLSGCYEDKPGDRVLSGRFLEEDRTMTTEVCAEFCEGSPYFGTEYGQECFCGADSDDPSRLGEASCTFPCGGDASQTCGGFDAISVYQYNIVDPPTPEFLGCWTDDSSASIMDVVESDVSNMTNELCAEICASYPFYGTQFGRECWCGDDMTDHTIHGESSSCNVACPGDVETVCGGVNAMSVWQHLVQ